jgi:tellurite methyltransferase
MNNELPNSKKYGPPKGYYEDTKNRPAHDLLRESLKYAKDLTGKTALDLGCGAGPDTKLLVENGYKVIAVDGSWEAEKYIKALPHQDKIKFIQSDFENFNFSNYDLINASRSLPFTHKDKFTDVFTKLKNSINTGGLFVGQLYGINDQWNKQGETMTFLSKEQVQELLDGLGIIKLEEKEYDGQVANGKPKHWHLFNIIATRK